ncbi:MAG: hypothetical protein AAF202_13245, partial [Pseudomonadota bacterium]
SLRGFVKSYASQLKMDVDEVLDAFHEEMGSTLVQTDVSQAEDSPKLEMPMPQPQTPAEESAPQQAQEDPMAELGEMLKKYGVLPKLFYAGVLVALVFLIYGVRNVVIKYEKESQVEAPKDIKGLDSAETAEKPGDESSSQDGADKDKEKLATEKASSAATEKQQAELSKAEPQEKEEENQTTQPKEEEKESTEVADNKPEESKKKAEPPKPDEELRSEPTQTTLQKPATSANTNNKFVDQNEIIIEAFDNVQIEFRIGKGDLQKVSLEPDQVHTIKANAQVRIDFSDGGAVNITHNGRDRGVPGDLGKPKKVILP